MPLRAAQQPTTTTQRESRVVTPRKIHFAAAPESGGGGGASDSVSSSVRSADRDRSPRKTPARERERAVTDRHFLCQVLSFHRVPFAQESSHGERVNQRRVEESVSSLAFNGFPHSHRHATGRHSVSLPRLILTYVPGPAGSRYTGGEVNGSTRFPWGIRESGRRSLPFLG